MTFLAAVGAAIITLAVVAGVVVGIGHLTTSEHSKQQNGVDLSWYAGAAFLAVPAALVAFFMVVLR